MRVIRAEAMGMCFGVRDALAVAEEIARPAEVTVHGELVHNPKVLVELESRGFHTTPEEDRTRLPETTDVLITAHGISDAERARLETAGKRLIDTTCPLVARVHRAAQELAADGWFVLLIGRRGHVEVRGIVEDLEQCEIVGGIDDVRRYEQARLGIVCQSTTPPRLADDVERAVRQRNPLAEIRRIDTICDPTWQRQAAVERLLDRIDVMVVVGGRNSNNTRQLVSLCEARHVPARHVESAEQLDPAWFEDCEAVGLTAGTSTLDATIDAVEEALLRISEGVHA